MQITFVVFLLAQRDPEEYCLFPISAAELSLITEITHTLVEMLTLSILTILLKM